jgi:hypothetical protein
MSAMSRIKPFVVLDALVTLPLFIWAAQDTFRRPHGDMFGFELATLICVVVVMLPSVVCLLGVSLRQIPAVVLILFYLLMLVLLWFRILSGWHELHHATLIRVGAFLLIAKSIFGVISVTKHAV